MDPNWHHERAKKKLRDKDTRPGDLVMSDPFGWLFSQNVDYFRPYKKQVVPSYKGHPIEFMVDFF